MARTIQAKDVSLHDLETQFRLQLTDDPRFFPEWRDNLPEITEQEQLLLDKIKTGYLNLIKYPNLLEHTVQMAVLSPLLYLADFYLAPFHLRTEFSVDVTNTDTDTDTNTDEEMTIEGKIDVLILKEHLSVVVIESKRVFLSIEAGLAQILSYLLANPNSNSFNLGMITTGSSFSFVKLIDEANPQYSLSRIFELRNPGNELYDVLRVLKRFRQLFLN